MSATMQNVDYNQATIKYANRGKSSESAVYTRFTSWNEVASVAWERLPDFKSGSKKVTTADFRVLDCGVTYYIEVKEIKDGMRLPFKNFDSGQIARLRRAKLAGAKTLVLVHSLGESTWWAEDVDYFFKTRQAAPAGVASWDLSNRAHGRLSNWLATPSDGNHSPFTALTRDICWAGQDFGIIAAPQDRRHASTNP